MPYTDSNGVRIYFEDRGVGETLLLIQGLGYTLDMWHRFAPRLAERYRLLVFDNRGVGRSDVPEPPYSIPDMARDAIAVLDAAEIERAHVVGTSLGGVVAQELALLYPERVLSLALYCTACGGSNAVAAEQEVIDILMARTGMTMEEGTRAVIPYIYDPGTPQGVIEEDLAIRSRTYPSAAGYLGQLMAVSGYDLSERLASLDVPALVVHGRSDRLIPPANGEDVATRIRGARLVMLENASHILFTDQPDACIDALSEFLDEISDRSGAHN